MPALQIRAEWTGLPGGPGLSTFNLGEETIANPQAAADALVAIVGEMATFLTSEITFTTLPEAYVMTTPSTVGSIVTIAPDSVTGSTAQAPLSGATQGLIKGLTQTFNGNRRVQGRLFIPGFTAAALNADGGTPAANHVAALSAMGTDLVGLGWQIPSRVLDAYAPVTTAQGWNQFAVLRSRRDA